MSGTRRPSFFVSLLLIANVIVICHYTHTQLIQQQNPIQQTTHQQSQYGRNRAGEAKEHHRFNWQGDGHEKHDRPSELNEIVHRSSLNLPLRDRILARRELEKLNQRKIEEQQRPDDRVLNSHNLLVQPHHENDNIPRKIEEQQRPDERVLNSQQKIEQKIEPTIEQKIEQQQNDNIAVKAVEAHVNNQQVEQQEAAPKHRRMNANANKREQHEEHCPVCADTDVLLLAEKLVTRRAAELAKKADTCNYGHELNSLIRNTFSDPILSTVVLLHGNLTFVTTGEWDTRPPRDPAAARRTAAERPMWIRDGAAQLGAYVKLAGDGIVEGVKDEEGMNALRRVLGNFVRMSAIYLLHDSYANAFHMMPRFQDFSLGRGGVVFTRNYELDSILWPSWLASNLWESSGREYEDMFDSLFFQHAEKIVNQIKLEQNRDFWQQGGWVSVYQYRELPNNLGSAVRKTGLSWSGFRASDDLQDFGFLCPANIMAVATLRRLADIMRHSKAYAGQLPAAQLYERTRALADDIDRAIEEWCVVDHYEFGKMYAFETDGMVRFQGPVGDLNMVTMQEAPQYPDRVVVDIDGKPLSPSQYQIIDNIIMFPAEANHRGKTVRVRGHYNFMDDANIPSLLSIPYFGYRNATDAIFNNTRRFVLSSRNRFYVTGLNRNERMSGVSSPHTGKRCLWHLGLIAQGFSALNDAHAERYEVLRMIVRSATGTSTGYLHEAFSPEEPSLYSRGWFSWANAEFGKWIDDMVRDDSLNDVCDPRIRENNQQYQKSEREREEMGIFIPKKPDGTPETALFSYYAKHTRETRVDPFNEKPQLNAAQSDISKRYGDNPRQQQADLEQRMNVLNTIEEDDKAATASDQTNLSARRKAAYERLEQRRRRLKL